MNVPVDEVSEIVRNVRSMMNATSVVGGCVSTLLLMFIIGANVKN